MEEFLIAEQPKEKEGYTVFVILQIEHCKIELLIYPY